jgi:hypothetical protein
MYSVMATFHENRSREALSFLVVVTENYAHNVTPESI